MSYPKIQNHPLYTSTDILNTTHPSANSHTKQDIHKTNSLEIESDEYSITHRIPLDEVFIENDPDTVFKVLTGSFPSNNNNINNSTSPHSNSNDTKQDKYYKKILDKLNQHSFLLGWPGQLYCLMFHSRQEQEEYYNILKLNIEKQREQYLIALKRAMNLNSHNSINTTDPDTLPMKITTKDLHNKTRTKYFNVDINSTMEDVISDTLDAFNIFTKATEYSLSINNLPDQFEDISSSSHYSHFMNIYNFENYSTNCQLKNFHDNLIDYDVNLMDKINRHSHNLYHNYNHEVNHNHQYPNLLANQQHLFQIDLFGFETMQIYWSRCLRIFYQINFVNQFGDNNCMSFQEFNQIEDLNSVIRGKSDDLSVRSSSSLGSINNFNMIEYFDATKYLNYQISRVEASKDKDTTANKIELNKAYNLINSILDNNSIPSNLQSTKSEDTSISLASYLQPWKLKNKSLSSDKTLLSTAELLQKSKSDILNEDDISQLNTSATTITKELSVMSSDHLNDSKEISIDFKSKDRDNLSDNLSSEKSERLLLFGDRNYNLQTIGIPEEIWLLLNAISSKVSTTVGIFRKPASAKAVKQLKQEINLAFDNRISSQELKEKLDNSSVHSLVGTLKEFLRSQHQPLLQHYADWLRISSILDQNSKLQRLNVLINNKLSTINRKLLAAIITLVAQVCENKNITNMTPNACSISLTPSLIWSETGNANDDIKNVANFINIIEFTIRYRHQLFKRSELNCLQDSDKASAVGENLFRSQTTSSEFDFSSLHQQQQQSHLHKPVDLKRSNKVAAKNFDNRSVDKILPAGNLPIRKLHSYESSWDDVLSVNSSGVDSGLSTSSICKVQSKSLHSMENHKISSSMDSLDILDPSHGHVHSQIDMAHLKNRGSIYSEHMNENDYIVPIGRSYKSNGTIRRKIRDKNLSSPNHAIIQSSHTTHLNHNNNQTHPNHKTSNHQHLIDLQSRYKHKHLQLTTSDASSISYVSSQLETDSIGQMNANHPPHKIYSNNYYNNKKQHHITSSGLNSHPAPHKSKAIANFYDASKQNKIQNNINNIHRATDLNDSNVIISDSKNNENNSRIESIQIPSNRSEMFKNSLHLGPNNKINRIGTTSNLKNQQHHGQNQDNLSPEIEPISITSSTIGSEKILQQNNTQNPDKLTSREVLTMIPRYENYNQFNVAGIESISLEESFV